MKQQIKDILGLLIIVLPACVFIFAWWLYSPMYVELKNQQEGAARFFLTATYYHDLTTLDPFVKPALIEHFGFTDDDINPRKLLNQFIEAQNENNN